MYYFLSNNGFLYVLADRDPRIKIQRKRPVQGWLHGLCPAYAWRRRQEGSVTRTLSKLIKTETIVSFLCV